MFNRPNKATPRILIGDSPNYFREYHTEIKDPYYKRAIHKIRYWGGFWELSFKLADADFTEGFLDRAFSSWLMSKVAEYFNGRLTWKGVVWEMVRVKDGKRQRRSMENVYNAVKCVYTVTDSATQVDTLYRTNDDSIERYLRRETLVYKDNISATQAVDEADAFLNTHYDAWTVTTEFGNNESAGLEVICFGYSRLLNNIFSTATTPAEEVDLSTVITDTITDDILTNFPFITIGGIDANTKQIQREQRYPTRVGDLVDALARVGNGTVPYRYFIGGQDKFRFEIMNTDPIMRWRGASRGGLTDINKRPLSWEAWPGVLEDTTAPPMPALSGSYLQKKNHELVEVMSMWQGQDQPQPEQEEATEEQILAYARQYERMITDGDFDRLHTPGTTNQEDLD